MKVIKILTIFTLLLFFSVNVYNIKVGSALYEQAISDYSLLLEPTDVDDTIIAPDVFNLNYLENVTYNEAVQSGRRFKWKVDSIEKTENFHVIEGDKRIKKGDQIILVISTNPELQLSDVNDWAQIYVNDVMARYSTTGLHVNAVFKYLQPLFLNITENGVNYTQSDYYDFLDTSPDVNQSIWTVYEDVAVYNNTIVTQTNNVTKIQITYDRKSGYMNELDFQASFTSLVNGTASIEGANMSIIRIHGFGLKYNITTWVIWIPILLFIIALIVAIRLHLFQRFKLYRESKKLAKRE